MCHVSLMNHLLSTIFPHYNGQFLYLAHDDRGDKIKLLVVLVSAYVMVSTVWWFVGCSSITVPRAQLFVKVGEGGTCPSRSRRHCEAQTAMRRKFTFT